CSICQDNNISYQTFFYWAKHLHSPDAIQTLQPIVFEEQRHSPSELVVIDFANGIRAKLPATLRAAQIKHWMGTLQ
ncbi:helix-turn-helix domain-containing protein, partial [Vibrio mimicus]